MLQRPVDAAIPRGVGSPAMVWIILLVVVGLIVVALITLYNRFVRLRNRVDNAWAQIEVQLKRRWDLIPNLVETVRGYAEHERGTFEAVTEARANAQRAQGPAETAAAEGILGQALGRLFAVAEAYPELQADENFRQLQDELAGTENRIAVSRQVYNDTVLTYNNAIQTFPGVVLAGPFNFTKREFFETDEVQRGAPQVDFTPGTGSAAPTAPPASPAEPGAGSSGAPGGTS
jgi:LemA protein